MGEELFAQGLRANPGRMAYLADGADEIDEVVRVRASDAAGALETAALVRQIGNHLLRARALAALAEALPASRKPALALRIEAPRR